jgi:hypothetical protein
MFGLAMIVIVVAQAKSCHGLENLLFSPCCPEKKKESYEKRSCVDLKHGLLDGPLDEIPCCPLASSWLDGSVRWQASWRGRQ